MTSTSLILEPLFAMAAPPDGGGNLLVQLIPFALILGIFYFIILLPMRRRQKKVAEFQAALKVGDNVVTTFGVYGQIAKLDDATVHLQVADKVRLKVSKAAIGGYQGQEPVVSESGNL
jgi:preprotein translocase subunit YajC